MGLYNLLYGHSLSCDWRRASVGIHSPLGGINKESPIVASTRLYLRNLMFHRWYWSWRWRTTWYRRSRWVDRAISRSTVWWPTAHSRKAGKNGGLGFSLPRMAEAVHHDTRHACKCFLCCVASAACWFDPSNEKWNIFRHFLLMSSRWGGANLARRWITTRCVIQFYLLEDGLWYYLAIASNRLRTFAKNHESDVLWNGRRTRLKPLCFFIISLNYMAQPDPNTGFRTSTRELHTHVSLPHWQPVNSILRGTRIDFFDSKIGAARGKRKSS